jgi:predicted Rossmann fold nucleotide-binding protein DprA/Smf involved in DNA uptake
MQLDSSLSWVALGLTPGLACRLSARVLRRFDSPDGVFRATLPDLEACHLPAQVAQTIVKKQGFKRAEKELAGIQKIPGCTLLNVTGSVAAAIDGSENKLYELLSADQPVHIDDIVERSGLNSSEVLATLFNLEMKGIIRQLPGKQFSKVLL